MNEEGTVWQSDLDALLQAAEAEPAVIRASWVSQAPQARPLLALDRAQQADLAAEVLSRLALTARRGLLTRADHNYRTALIGLATALLRRKMTLDEQQVLRLAEAASRFKLHYVWHLPMPHFLSRLEGWVDTQGLDPALRSALEPFAAAMRGTANEKKRKLLVERLEALLDRGEAD